MSTNTPRKRDLAAQTVSGNWRIRKRLPRITAYAKATVGIADGQWVDAEKVFEEMRQLALKSKIVVVTSRQAQRSPTPPPVVFLSAYAPPKPTHFVRVKDRSGVGSVLKLDSLQYSRLHALVEKEARKLARRPTIHIKARHGHRQYSK